MGVSPPGKEETVFYYPLLEVNRRLRQGERPHRVKAAGLFSVLLRKNGKTMTRFESLVHLVHSMTMPEKKAFRSKVCHKRKPASYQLLYDIIEKSPSDAPETIRQAFLTQCPGSAFETTVKYLFSVLLDIMHDLKKNQDNVFMLFNKILNARILYEKSLFDECFDTLETVKQLAVKYENDYALLMANRLELDYLLALNFPNTSEQELLKKQFRINEALKGIRKVNEQSSLYEILRHRTLYKGYARSQKEKNELNDLIYSELSLVASLSPENFEISKLHQLFQSNYLISVGDFKSALRSYYELINLFEANKHLWNSPPLYYMYTIEGVLETLRSIRDYEGMRHFTDQLRKIESNSLDFRLNQTCVVFLYELFPLLDAGEFRSALELKQSYREVLFDRFHLLSRTRQAELCLYTGLIHFGNGDFQAAHRELSRIIVRGKSYFYLPLYRTIRLVNLMILYKLGDGEPIRYEIRSLRRDLSGNEKGYRIELLMLRFLIKQLPVTRKGKRKLLEKYLPEFEEIRTDVFEQQILRIIDFTAWMESELLMVPLAEVLAERTEQFAADPVI